MALKKLKIDYDQLNLDYKKTKIDSNEFAVIIFKIFWQKNPI